MRRNGSDLFSRAQRLFAVIALVALGYTMVALVAPIPESRDVLAMPTPTLMVQGYLAPGNTVRINGGLFIPGETATLSYDTTVFATVKVVQTLSIFGTYVGGFTAPFTVPTSTTTGAHSFTAVAQPSGLTAQICVTVNANWAQYGFTATNTRRNPYETAIDATNVSHLAVAWSFLDPNNSGFFTSNTPSVHDGTIYFTTDGDNTTYGNNASSGVPLWSFQTPNAPTGPGEPAVSGATLYTTGYYLYALAAASGSNLWQANSSYLVESAPTFANGMVYVTSNGSLAAFNANGCGAYECAASWLYTDSLGSIVGTPAVANGLMYVGTTTGKLIVVGASTGILQWTGTIATGSSFGPGAPVVDNGMVFIASGGLYASSSTLYAFPATGCGSATCAPSWSAAVGQQFGQGQAYNLAIANGSIFVSSTDWHLYAFSENGCGARRAHPSGPDRRAARSTRLRP